MSDSFALARFYVFLVLFCPAGAGKIYSRERQRDDYSIMGCGEEYLMEWYYGWGKRSGRRRGPQIVT
jgi:hypothetical protein